MIQGRKLEKMQSICCTRNVIVALITVAALTGSCIMALGQNAAAPAPEGEQILILMSDGTSAVFKPGKQPLKIRTASGESEVPLSKIVYVYRGKARLHSGQGIISGEVLDSLISLPTEEGDTKPISAAEILFLSGVKAEPLGKAITRLEIIVADGKVTKNVLAPATASTRHDEPNKPSAATSALSSVVILDEYWEDRLYTLSNLSYGEVVKKAAQTFHGPPFPVECDVVTHQEFAPEPLMTIFLVSAETGRGVRMGQSCRPTVAGSASLVKGLKKRTKEDFGMCLRGIEGSGEVYLFVEASGPREVKKKALCTVELYKTVSNVLRLPVQFE
jgi:hypothetical protein